MKPLDAIDPVIIELLKKAKDAEDGGDAMKFAQAVANLVQAKMGLHDIDKD